MTQPAPEFYALQRAVAGRYSLERELGRGGMGVVFLARDVALDRPVAIKLLPPSFAASAEHRERFLREARMAARLSHPHIVPIHAVEEIGDVVFYVMAFVDGETLGERVRRDGPLPADDALRITQEVAWALGHAHARGVIHRDVKPDNVLLERGTGRALVTDFGIARGAESTTPVDGTAVGTPAYMSPEQASGERVDARSDVYSLGVTAFFAASGQLPFQAPSAHAMVLRHLTATPPSLLALRPSLPPELARAIDRCLAKEPGARWADADALAVALGEVRGRTPEVPAPVREFVNDADSAGAQLGAALIAAIVAFAWIPFANDFFGILRAAMLFAGTLVLGFAALRIGQLALRANALLGLGYGHDAVRPAIALAQRARMDQPPRRASRRALATLNVIGFGVFGTSLFYWLSNRDVPQMLAVLAVVATVVGPTAVLQRLWSEWRAGKPSLWLGIIDGAFGRALFAPGRGRRLAVPVAGEPTVLALGRAAEDLFEELSSSDRARLGDVPALLARLQADAMALRARGADAAAPVAAIEAVRLDLLRLHAGGGTLHELTRDVDAAREIGRRIDAELAAREEIDTLG